VRFLAFAFLRFAFSADCAVMCVCCGVLRVFAVCVFLGMLLMRRRGRGWRRAAQRWKGCGIARHHAAASRCARTTPALTRTHAPAQALSSRELEGAPLLLLANKLDLAGTHTFESMITQSMRAHPSFAHFLASFLALALISPRALRARGHGHGGVFVRSVGGGPA
jgi:hypothetical protein